MLDFINWDINFCQKVAFDEQIELTDEHMIVIHFLRDYFSIHKKSPAIRELVSSLKKTHGEKIGNSLFLQILFPNSPAVQAAKLAGLPKPKRCI